MKNQLWIGKRILAKDQDIGPGAIVVRDGKIMEVLECVPSSGDFIRYEFAKSIIAPGFIDVHVHGGDGHDVMDGTQDALNGLALHLASTGTTGFLATTVTASDEQLRSVMQTVRDAMAQGTTGAQILGLHLEGPYIHPKRKGAQNGEFIRKPNPDELKHYIEQMGGALRLMTMAPELDANFQTISLAKAYGVTVSAGHSCCSFETADAAFAAGITHATHLFNGMEPLHHRNPGLAGAVLSDDRVTAEVIADGVHLHPGTLRVVLAAKGVRRVALITDCMRAGNLSDGQYDLGGLKVNVSRGIARTDEGNLAGSTLNMIDAVRNTLRWTDVSLRDAVLMASANPARQIGWDRQKGALAVGLDADFVVLNEENLNVEATVVRGEMVYRRGS